MNEKDRVRRFEQQLEKMTGQPASAEANTRDTDETASLAAELARLDVSGDSQVRDGLKQRLLMGSPGSLLRSSWIRRHRLLAAVLALMISIGAWGVISPSTLAAAVRPVLNLLTRIKVGEHTELIQTEAPTPAFMDSVLAQHASALDSGTTWFMMSDYGGMGGFVPEGIEPVIKQTKSLRVANRLTDFDLLVPTWYPEQIPDQLRFNEAYVMPGSGVLLKFGISSLEFIIQAVAVGPQMEIASSRATAQTDSNGNMVTTTIEPNVTTYKWDGQKVVWERLPEGFERNLRYAHELEEGQVRGELHWEADGLSLRLAGQNLTLEMAEKIYRSLRPYTAK